MSDLHARTVEIDDPGDILALAPEASARLWLHDGNGLVAWGTAAALDDPAGPSRFDRARGALDRVFADMTIDDPVGVPGSGPVAFASFTFDPDTKGSRITVPRVLVGRGHGRAWVTVVAPAGDGALADPAAQLGSPPPAVAHERVRYAGSSLPEIGWLAAVAEAVTEIRAGAYEKVVLARDRRVWSHREFDPRLLARRLAERFPTCFTFAVDGLVGATPELLVRREDAELTSLVLAGSAARGDDAAADEALGSALRASAKEASEHGPAVESVRRALAGCTEDLRADAEPWLLRLANVTHLATTVRARVPDPGLGALALAGMLHPTAAVGGMPTAAALPAIRRLEGMDRGRYAAPVGWVDARGDGEFGIALRCAELSGTSARLFAGGGVVAGSLPESELEETRLKLRAMQSAFEG